MRLLLENQRQLWNLINDHLPKIEQNNIEFGESLMIKPKACKTCGEIGHTSKECTDEWPHGHTRHPVREYPTNQISCFLCEATNHVPTQCQLYPVVQEVSQQAKKRMQQNLMEYVEVQGNKEENKRDTRHITCFTCGERGHYSWDCKEKRIGQDTEQNPHQTKIVDHTGVKSEIKIMSFPRTSKSTSKCCYKCKGDHLARSCHIKRDWTSLIEIEYSKQDLEELLALETPKKKKKKNLSDVICYKCKDKGHYADKCPEKMKEKCLTRSHKKIISPVTCRRCGAT
jgi:predicted Zn-ribbon and HTH transcriptional regulator/DNA-directed RNA polymerase subunit N (RpoN/RPB10)